MQKDKQHRAGDLRLLNADRSLAVPTELKLYAQKQLVRNQGAKTGSWRASCLVRRRAGHGILCVKSFNKLLDGTENSLIVNLRY